MNNVYDEAIPGVVAVKIVKIMTTLIMVGNSALNKTNGHEYPRPRKAFLALVFSANGKVGPSKNS